MILLAIEDVTELKQRDEALKVSEPGTGGSSKQPRTVS